MGKHLAKYLIFSILLYVVLGVGWYFLYGSGELIKGIFQPTEDKIVVLVEAGYDVKKDWSYKVKNIVDDIKNKNQGLPIEVYYFNQTYEPVPKNYKGEYDFYKVSPYGDVDYGKIDAFEKETKKKITHLIGSNNIKKYSKNRNVIVFD